MELLVLSPSSFLLILYPSCHFVFELSTVHFELEEDAEYARLDQVDESISTLMAEIGAFKGSNVPPNPERVYVWPGKIVLYSVLCFIFQVSNLFWS